MFTFLVDMPTEIKGFTMIDDEGNHIIILNSRLNHEANLQSYLHELKHKEDFTGKFIDPDILENLRHAKEAR